MRHNPHDVHGTEDLDIATIRPIADYLLVEELKRDRTAGGIILPDGEKREWLVAKVLKVGTGWVSEHDGKLTPLPFKVGDVVLFMDYAGDRLVMRGDKQYRFLRAVGAWATVVLDEDNGLKSLTPLTDHILVEPHKTVTRGGIVVPDTAQQHLITCDVIEPGTGYLNPHTHVFHENEVEKGEQVIMAKYAGAALKLGGKDYRLIQKADIKCRLPKGVVVG